ncbi:hypothetical protein N657DRAFT_268512 [Parathielavia appendiculata]|uniref:Uncharacterized protein n=1 Tax=Parathielavia appendiculata TaxID=2587402 RepID=A0AAN6U446_9PEZI|nr:hypothetical protein N657DRAFT_268512 [Parathielavia appendiculata]
MVKLRLVNELLSLSLFLLDEISLALCLLLRMVEFMAATLEVLVDFAGNVAVVVLQLLHVLCGGLIRGGLEFCVHRLLRCCCNLLWLLCEGIELVRRAGSVNGSVSGWMVLRTDISSGL